MKTKLSQKGRTHKKSWMPIGFLVIAFILISFSSALEWDNVYDYNTNEDSVIIKNAFGLGEDLAYLKLIWGDTLVPAGTDVHIGTFELELTQAGWGDEIFDSLDLVDLKNDRVMTRGKQYKVKTIKQDDDYVVLCDNIDFGNGTIGQDCYREETGKKDVIEWVPISNPNFEFEAGIVYEVGVFVDVEVGDHGDWLPSMMGVKIVEWAEWTQGLNVGLVSYWNFNETSGGLIDLLGINNGSNAGVTLGVAGKIENAYSYLTNDYTLISDSTSLDMATGDFGISFWVKADTTQPGNDAFIFSKTAPSYEAQIQNQAGEKYIRFIIADKLIELPANSLKYDVWQHYVVSYDANGDVDIYINGSNFYNGTGWGAINNTAADFQFGRRSGTNNLYFNGDLDEMAIYNRTISNAEALQFYNDYNGITYTDQFGEAPKITLITPSNNSILTSSSVDFEVTVTDDQYVQNVSLYIDGVLNQTDTSHTNGTYNFNAIVPEGLHNWSILAYDNDSLSNQSETWYFNYTQPPVFVELLNPNNGITSNNITLNMSCIGYKDTGVIQLNMTIDGVLNQTITNSTPSQNLSINELLSFSEGEHNWSCSTTDGMSSATSSTRTFTIDTTPFIEFITPPTLVNYANVSQEYIPMKVNVSTLYFANITYSLMDVNGTNYTKFYTNETFDINFTNIPDAHYHYDVRICTSTGRCNRTETRHVNHDNTLPVINITSPVSLYDYLIDEQIIDLNWTVTDLHLDSCWYVYSNLSNFSSNRVIPLTSLPEYWNIDNGTNSSSPGRNTLYTNSLFPSLQRFVQAQSTNGLMVSPISSSIEDCTSKTYSSTVSYGSSDVGKFFCAKNENNNYYIIRINSYGLGTTGENDNMTAYRLDQYVNCSINTTSFAYDQGINNITFFANDTFGGVSSYKQNWTTLIGTFAVDYTSPVYEGVLNTITATVIPTSGASITAAKMYYNGTNYSTSINYSSGTYIISTSIPSPPVNVDTNFTFGFYLTINGTVYDPQQNNQTVLNANLGECGVASNDTILTMNLVDEDTQVSILGDIEIGGEIKSISSGQTIGTIYLLFNNTNNASVCFSPPSAYDLYYMDAEIRYSSDGYSPELYYIQNADITNDLGNLTLYDLNSSSSTRFKVTYQDSTYNFVEGAIVQLQRKYISEGVYKTVEAPLTSNEGVSVLHINLNSIAYRATVVKDGVVLDEFENLVFNCQSELTGECTHQLLGSINPGNEQNLDTTRDFYYSNPSLNETSNSISVSFSVPSGSPSSVNIILEQKDIFGNKTLCNQTIISSSGSIECAYSDALGESYIDFTIYKNGESIAKKSYVIHPDSYLDWLDNNYIFILVLLFSLVGMALTSPEWIVVAGVISFVISGGLFLAQGLDFVVGLGSIVWLLIAAIIIIFKMAKQEDR